MSIVKITFDSNVWRIVASPYRFPKEPSISSFEIIKSHIQEGNALGFLAETVFTLEAIKKADRRKFFQDYMPKFAFSEIDQSNDRRININIAPDSTSHPGSNHYLTTHLEDAVSLGFRVLPSTRIAWIKNPDLKNEWMISPAQGEISDYAEMFGEVVDKIKNLRSCSYDLEQIGKQYASKEEHWTEGLKKAPSSEDTRISKAFAEWADGDAIAMHIAYKNCFFCTRDLANSAGDASVLSTNNRALLEKIYGVKFITPKDLSELLQPNPTST